MHPDALFTVPLIDRPVTLYGVLIAVGILCCLVVFFKYTKKEKLPLIIQDFCFYVAIIAIALGFLAAALFQSFYNFLESGVWNFGGITAMGGFVGGAVAFILAYFIIGKLYFPAPIKAIYKQEFNKIVLVAPCCITVAHAFGRIGCLMAGCCHGTYLGQNPISGGLWMKGVSNGWGYYIPTQLYEAIFLFILFGVLTLLFFKRSNITMPVYLISYAIWRFIIEIFRGDPRGATVLGLEPSQWMSVLFIVLGVGMLVYYKVKKIPYVLPPEEPEKTEE